jgi:lipoate-protein ligase A
MFHLRVLDTETADGPTNMGLDLALLDAVDADPTQVILRFYRWSEPTLSVGYFQHYADALADPRWLDAPIVRRPSGGGALWHDDDLTYALVVPRAHALAARPQVLYRTVHAALTEALRDRGADAYRRAERPSAAEASPRSPFLCFLDRDPEDVLVDGHKVIGSAQRRRPRAVLQHGSILSRTSPATPELPGLDRVAIDASSSAWIEESTQRLAQALGLSVGSGSHGPATAAERAAAVAHARGVFSTPAWTRRR